ncbi:hypothetical protein QYP00_21185 [Pseudomonas aeruginosa]|nr:hypothetical protein [Pseudomonas aeruginosa]
MTALALTSRSLFPACAALALGGLLTLLAGSVAAAPAKTKRPPFIEQGETCLPQPLPASVLYLAGDAWKLDAKGNQTPLEEGMDIDELEGVKTSPTAFVSLLLGDGSRIVLPSSSEVTLHLDEDTGIPQIALRAGLLPAPQLRGQGGEHGESPVWKLYLAPLHGAKRYRAQVASDPDFLRIQQERFSSTPEVSFSGLKAAFYHVRLSAFDNDGLEGETSVYDILYYPRGGSAR